MSRAAVLVVACLLAACGGGNSGPEGEPTAAGTGEGITLLSITYPECTDLSGALSTPPRSAPLSQQVVFRFSGPVEGPVTDAAIRISADPGPDYAGPLAALHETANLIAARGSFETRGSTVVFTPFIPTGEIDLSPKADPNRVPGLLPGVTYDIFLPVGTKGSLAGFTGFAFNTNHTASFATTPTVRPSKAYSNHPVVPPNVIATKPKDGARDFPVNAFDDIPGFPPNSDIILHFDQPLDMSADNLEGEDLDGDGFGDASFFLGYSEPRLYCAVDKSSTQAGFIAALDGATDAFELVGFTRYLGAAVGLKSIVFRRAHGGEQLFPMVGCTGTKLYDVLYEAPAGMPPVCELTNERSLGAGTEAVGLALNREGEVYALDAADGSLLRIDTDTGAVEVIGLLPPGSGELVDLCWSPENDLYGLRVSRPGSPSAVCAVERINIDTLETVTAAAGLRGDYTSFGFSLADTAVLYEASSLRRAVLDLGTGMITELGAPISDPLMTTESRLDFDLRRFEIGTNPVLKSNSIEGAKVKLKLTGLLPFGSWIDVRVRYALKNLSGGSKSKEHGKSALGAETAATVRTFGPGTGAVEDRFLEVFLDNKMEDTRHELADARALWNVSKPNYHPPVYQHLLAGLSHAGAGELGDFVPVGVSSIVWLDTDCQAFPLADGSTPGVTKPVVVYGGEFHFDDIIIPDGVSVVGVGGNPLVLSAAGRVEIGGTIEVSGENGTDDVTFNAGFIPVPGGAGGAGGGRGGMGQPYIPPDFKKWVELQSVPRGEPGYGPGDLPQGGGEGGQSGAKGPNVPWQGSGHDEGSRGAGGGGGSFLQAGRDGCPGKGQYGVNLYGDYYIRDPYYYWDGSYEEDLNWKPGDPLTPKLNEWFDLQDPLFGAAGSPVFNDGDPSNDFIGPGGEVQALQGGQGGGGGGSRLDSMNPGAQQWAAGMKPPLAPSAADAKGGGGGGGGGAVAVHSLGEIVIAQTGRILARGGKGGGGEVIGHSNFGGGGGGGSGGAIILNSADRIEIEHDGADAYGRLDVSGGWGNDAKTHTKVTYAQVYEPCKLKTTSGQLSNPVFCSWSRGDGGSGGYGIIQLMVPDPANDLEMIGWPPSPHDELKSVEASLCEVAVLPNEPKRYQSDQQAYYSYYRYEVAGSPGSYYALFPKTTDCLVDPHKTPASFGPESYAVSKWINTGMAAYRPGIGGVGAPVFLDFEGIKTAGDWGVVDTVNGYVKNAHIPDFNDIAVDAPDLALKDYIPADNEVAIQFQATDAVYPGSKIPNENPAVVSDWTWDLNALSGRQFLRFKVRFNVAKGTPLMPYSTKPQVNKVRVRMEY